MARVVITGGAGFVGSQLGYALHREGHDVVLLDDMSFGKLDNLIIDGAAFGTFLGRDIRDRRLPDYFAGAHTVFHFAGIAALPVCQSEPHRAYDVNTAGTAAVLEAARQSGVQRVVFASTSAVYECNTKLPQAPEDPVAPDLVYAMTKHAAEAICRGYARNTGLDVVVLRLFNVYGPHQDMHRTSPPFTSYVARELAAGRRPVLYNQTDARRDYIHSADLIRLLKAVFASERTFAAEVFNAGSGTAWSVPELYALMQQAAGTSIEAEFRDPGTFWDAYPALFSGRGLSRERLKKEVYKTSLSDISRTTETFDWAPEIGMAEGLATVVAYARTHL